MKPRSFAVAFVLGFCPFVRPAEAPSGALAAPAPAQGWALPLFTREGYRKTNLSGDRVTEVNADQVDVVNIKILSFSGDASEKIASILVSPQASYFHKENRANGPKGVRMIRDDLEISGDGAWTYDQATDTITVHKNVRVAFKAHLSELLK